jgi:hypothetical protein
MMKLEEKYVKKSIGRENPRLLTMQRFFSQLGWLATQLASGEPIRLFTNATVTE